MLSISASSTLNFTLAVPCVGPQIEGLETQSLSFPVAFFYCFINLMLIKYIGLLHPLKRLRLWVETHTFTKERNHHSTCVWVVQEVSCRNLGSQWHRASITYDSISALLNSFFFNMRSHQEWEENLTICMQCLFNVMMCQQRCQSAFCYIDVP